MPISASDPTYRMRFEFLVSKCFDVDVSELKFELVGRSAILKSVQGRPLNEAEAVTIEVGGFRDESEAREFGLRLQRAATLAATKTGLGVAVGDNRNRSGISDAVRKAIFDKCGIEVRNRVHGIDVYREDIPVRIFHMEGDLTVRADPRNFLSTLDESFTRWFQPVTSALERALRLHAEANLARDSLARMFLAIASVEALTPDESWSPTQTKILHACAAVARSFEAATPEEIEEVHECITRQRKLGTRASFRRLFDRLGIAERYQPWARLYDKRSAFLHGRTLPANALAAIDETLSFSREIVLMAAVHEIGSVDSIMRTALAGDNP